MFVYLCVGECVCACDWKVFFGFDFFEVFINATVGEGYSQVSKLFPISKILFRIQLICLDQQSV